MIIPMFIFPIAILTSQFPGPDGKWADRGEEEVTRCGSDLASASKGQNEIPQGPPS